MNTKTDTLSRIFLPHMGICCAMGMDKQEVAQSAFLRMTSNMPYDTDYLQAEGGCHLGKVGGDLLPVPADFARYRSRNNRLLLTAFEQIRPAAERAIATYGKERVAIILGTSTSGIDEGEKAFFHRRRNDAFPNDHHLGVQFINNAAEFLSHYLGLRNVAYTISTACSSSAKVFSSAAELMAMGVCDAAIVGGVDSLCKMTVNGFNSLGALSSGICNPFSRNRTGITIGEGAALFLMEKEPSPIAIAGVGESSDAYAMTAPEPRGKGAEAAMRAALRQAGIAPEDIDYINLHGTGTLHNDAMESQAVERVFGAKAPCSSTKALTGHTLGAAGAIETALCWLMLSDTHNPARRYLPHIWDGQRAEDVALEHFTAPDAKKEKGDWRYVLSNSFAFGGSNTAIILAKED